MAELGEVLTGSHPGRTDAEELTLFKSLGLAVEDLAAAELIVGKARKEGLGTEVESLIPARRDRARPRDRSPARRSAHRSCASPSTAPAEIWLKLENLQPIGSFKLRGAVNAMPSGVAGRSAEGVVTASAGNMAQGVAWAARELGVPATVVVPDHAPQAKIDAIERLGGRVVKVPFERWWRDLLDVAVRRARGLFIHPVPNERVMAGNGTIGLEILEDLPDVDAVVVPCGGGGLVAGIASALARCGRHARVYAARGRRPPRRSLPSLAAGAPREAELPAVLRRRHRRQGRAARRCGARTAAARRRPRRLARRDRRRRAPAGRARARGRRRRGCARPSRPRCRVAAGRGRSCAWSRAATSTPHKLVTILEGGTPD